MVSARVKFALLAALALVAFVVLEWDTWQSGRAQQVVVQVRAGEVFPAAGEGLIPPENRWTVVHLWATWCPTCMGEMPGLMAFLTAMPPHGSVVMVSLDEDAEKLAGFMARRVPEPLPGVRWMHDPQQVLAGALSSPVKLPTTWLVGPGGVVIQRFDGVVDWAGLPKVLP